MFSKALLRRRQQQSLNKTEQQLKREDNIRLVEEAVEKITYGAMQHK